MRATRWLTAVLAAVLILVPAARPADDDPEVGGRHVSQWLSILHDPKAKVNQRKAAILVLQLVGPRVKGVVAGLSQAVREDADAEVRQSAADTLGGMGAEAKDAVRPLTEALKSDKAEAVREAAARALGRMGAAAQSAVPVLAAALKEKRVGTRVAAAEALGHLGAEARTTVTPLTEALHDPDRFVRFYAAFALGRIGSAAGGAVNNLSNLAVKDPYPNVRRAALEALARVAPDGEHTAALLAGALKDKDTDVRRAAAVTLGRLGKRARNALPALVEALHDPDQYVRGQAVHAIGGIGATALGKDLAVAVRELADRLQKDDVAEVRVAAADELRGLGPAARAAVPALTNARSDPSRTVRDAAAEALKRVQGPP